MKTAETQALLNIDLNREDVRSLIDLRSGDGWRYLIQHGLYRHIQDRTGSRFYTPFFIHSVEAHRSYWLLHLSNHREARDEMGKLHWRLNNHFQHHGGAGFHALGFDPSKDLRQGLLTFMFDDGRYEAFGSRSSRAASTHDPCRQSERRGAGRRRALCR